MRRIKRLKKHEIQSLKDRMLDHLARENTTKRDLARNFPELSSGQFERVFNFLKGQGLVKRTGHAQWSTYARSGGSPNEVADKLASDIVRTVTKTVDHGIVDEVVLLIVRIGDLDEAQATFRAALEHVRRLCK